MAQAHNDAGAQCRLTSAQAHIDAGSPRCRFTSMQVLIDAGFLSAQVPKVPIRRRFPSAQVNHQRRLVPIHWRRVIHIGRLTSAGCGRRRPLSLFRLLQRATHSSRFPTRAPKRERVFAAGTCGHMMGGQLVCKYRKRTTHLRKQVHRQNSSARFPSDSQFPDGESRKFQQSQSGYPKTLHFRHHTSIMYSRRRRSPIPHTP